LIYVSFTAYEGSSPYLSLGYRRDTNTVPGYSFALGLNNDATAFCSYALGYYCQALAPHSFATGYYTTAGEEYMTVMGSFNKTKLGAYLVVGKGTSTSSRSDAMVLDLSGNLTVAGTIKSGNTTVALSNHNHDSVYQAKGNYASSSHTHGADDITSGTLGTARIPDLGAGKITSGTFDKARIPTTLRGTTIDGTLKTSSGNSAIIGNDEGTSAVYVRASNSGNNVALYTFGSGTGSYNSGLRHMTDTGSSTGKWFCYINTSGTITNSMSDRRKKEDHGALGELEAKKILSVPVVKFVYKEDIGVNDML